MDRNPATGDAGARERARAADPARRETAPPAPGERWPEREGPLELERLRKDDGRALIVYRRVQEPEYPVAGHK